MNVTTDGLEDGREVPGQPDAMGADRTLRLGLWVFLISLTVLFGAGIVLFILARTGGGGHVVQDSEHGVRVALPLWIWISTFLVFSSSVALHQGLQWGRLGLFRQARRAFWAATWLGWGFALFQMPGIWVLLERYGAVEGIRPVAVFLVVALAALHLIHAAGGLVALTVLAIRSSRHDPGPNHIAGWRDVSLYWHFLAGVWLALFAVFAFVR